MIDKVTGRIKKLLPKNKFARSVSVLVGGTAGAQILLVLAAPILTRLYTPEDFGLLAVYASLLGLISVVSSLSYELAIPLPEEDQQAANVAVLCLILIIVSTLLTGALSIFLGQSISIALGVPQLVDYLWLLPVGVLLGGGYKVFNYWGIRTKRFAIIAATKLRQTLATLFFQLVAFKLGGFALLLGQVSGQGVGTTSLALPALRSGAFKNIRLNALKLALSRYKRFPIYSTWGGLSNTAGSQLPPLLFASLFSPAAAGLYALANRVLHLPMSLVGTAIGQVFFAEAAEARRQGKINELVAGLHSKLAHIGMAPALMLVLVGPDLFAWVFGNDWRMAGEFARWMAPWLYLVFVSSPLSTLFAVMEQQLQGMMFQIILLVSRIGAIFVGAAMNDLMLTVKLFAGVSALCWLGFLFWVARLAGNSARSMIDPTVKAFLIGLLCSAPIALYSLQENPTSNWLLVALAASTALLCFRYWKLLNEAY